MPEDFVRDTDYPWYGIGNLLLDKIRKIWLMVVESLIYVQLGIDVFDFPWLVLIALQILFEFGGQSNIPHIRARLQIP